MTTHTQILEGVKESTEANSRLVRKKQNTPSVSVRGQVAGIHNKLDQLSSPVANIQLAFRRLPADAFNPIQTSNNLSYCRKISSSCKLEYAYGKSTQIAAQTEAPPAPAAQWPDNFHAREGATQSFSLSVRSNDAPDTIPVDATHLETVDHNGRQYQRYAVENGIYFAPVDEDEVERLSYMHRVFEAMFDNRLIFPPVPRPRRILDCGYGCGSWAIGVAEQYPNCEVIGIDVYPYPIPNVLPPNLDLQVDDLNSPSTFPANHFDMVHSRMMSGGIHSNRWAGYMKDILRVLRPGGWCQMVEVYFNAQSDNGTLTKNHALQVWSQRYLESTQPYKDPRAPLRLRSRMTEAGFVEVESRLITLPLCGWSNDARDRAVGDANRLNTQRLLSSLAEYPLSTMLGMSSTDIALLVAQARAEADNPAFMVIMD
ncbi:S-adenosyl-L-methionine-dependent methyltransferase [Lasiosphaeria miniovina]|uniref:S-adenosyl-L-methionine-dependent methyltransferase n=1 Tax=Lasiosphaeria miniovina TaxID=1954250 RepID=A0AA40A6L4_9PEZI|nr:S-adenosyl-L-methionine-dependent methyltransferase [Lasiosphaeria miniovina]KAK0710274.1 S-adenosyl-L-methionine-dependent methyltransferase [Lasiosphaeria miniovina]